MIRLGFALLARLIAFLTILQIAVGIIRQALLIAQGFAQIFHCLLTGTAFALTIALPVTLGDLHVFHELTQLFHKFSGFGGFPFLHQLLQLVQHLLQLVLRHLYRRAVLRGFLFAVALIFFGQLIHVIIQGFAHFLHQLVNFFGRGAVFDCLVQTVLRAAQAFLG